MKYVVWLLLLVLVIVHQDVWFWDDPTLVWGFMPVTLLFHAGISLGAGITWYLAPIFAWTEVADEQAAGSHAGADAP
mgnify:CR=1 FL=1